MKRVRGFDFKIQGTQAVGTLPDGSLFIVDEQRIPDIEQLKWHKNKDGYISNYTRKRKGVLLLHRWLLGITNPTVIVDHVNRDRLDCRLENLRVVTFHQNSCNHKLFITNQTGYAGVYYSNRSSRYEAKIGYMGKRIYLGASVDDPLYLSQLYNIAARYLYGDYVGILNDVATPSLDDVERIHLKCEYHKQRFDSLQSHIRRRIA